MSALAGVFGPAAGSSGPVLQEMFAAMRNRAAGEPESVDVPGARVGAARHNWEVEVSGWSGPLVARDERWIVAADASIYYLADFRRQLRLTTRESGTGELLLAALRRWGPHFTRYLEGDFAIVAYERQRERVLLARDFGGRRSLVYSLAGRSLVVASSPNAVVCHPNVSADYDLGFIAASASAVIGPGHRTAYRNVAVVPGGSTLSIEGGRVCEVDRWAPAPAGSAWEPESPAAAEELRFLLQEATKERLATTGATTVWMSGGWDSTAVFASACAALDSSGSRASRPILPISMTYPADDTGNEDDHIRAVAERWSAPIRWIDADQIPLIADSDRRARLRDDPMMQPFEGKMRKLSQLTRELGSRIALDGFGGDQLFQVSTSSVIADHLYYARWSHLWHEWRQWSGTAREFARLAVLPLTSPALRRWVGAIRGRPVPGIWDRGFPDWIVASPEVTAELEPEFEQRPDEGAAEYEWRKGMCTSLVARAVSWNFAFGLDEGVLLRTPLFDRRVVTFAASRPLSDRRAGEDGKWILRRAMAGLIPESVLAPRRFKTGTPAGYFKRQFQGAATAEVAKLFVDRRSELERLGLVNRSALLQATEQYAARGSHGVGAIIQQTLEAERWLAARVNAG